MHCHNQSPSEAHCPIENAICRDGSHFSYSPGFHWSRLSRQISDSMLSPESELAANSCPTRSSSLRTNMAVQPIGTLFMFSPFLVLAWICASLARASLRRGSWLLIGG